MARYVKNFDVTIKPADITNGIADVVVPSSNFSSVRVVNIRAVAPEVTATNGDHAIELLNKSASGNAIEAFKLSGASNLKAIAYTPGSYNPDASGAARIFGSLSNAAGSREAPLYVRYANTSTDAEITQDIIVELVLEYTD